MLDCHGLEKYSTQFFKPYMEPSQCKTQLLPHDALNYNVSNYTSATWTSYLNLRRTTAVYRGGLARWPWGRGVVEPSCQAAGPTHGAHTACFELQITRYKRPHCLCASPARPSPGPSSRPSRPPSGLIPPIDLEICLARGEGGAAGRGGAGGRAERALCWVGRGQHGQQQARPIRSPHARQPVHVTPAWPRAASLPASSWPPAASRRAGVIRPV